jgi:microcystin-dependent protein
MSFTKAELLSDTLGNNLASGTIPIGGIIMWYGSATTSPITIGGITYPGIPTGWNLCDGSTVNNLKTPDLRERFIVGAGGNNLTVAETSGYGTHEIGGFNYVSLDVNNLPPHSHTLDPRILTEGIGNTGLGGPTPGVSEPIPTTGETGNGIAHENRPPYYALAFIMRVS